MASEELLLRTEEEQIRAELIAFEKQITRRMLDPYPEHWSLKLLKMLVAGIVFGPFGASYYFGSSGSKEKWKHLEKESMSLKPSLKLKPKLKSTNCDYCARPVSKDGCPCGATKI